jgi:hypothetical protein
VQKRDVVHALRTGQQATVHKYQDVVTKLENVIETRRARLTVSQESLPKKLYLQLTKHASMEPIIIVVVSPENNSNAGNGVSTSTTTMNKTFLQEELLSQESLDPPENAEDWQKYQSKWTRLVQTVADNVYEQAVSPTVHQCAVLERVVQGYQHHLGLEATAMEVNGGSGGTGNQQLESTNNTTTTTTTTTTVANSVDTTVTATLDSGATTGSMDDRAGNTGPNEFTGMHHPTANNDQQVDKTVPLPATAETDYTASEHVQK